MAELDITDDHVDVRLTPAERFFALRGDYRFDRRSVESVEVFDEGLDATSGVRAPGLGIPGRRRVGTWRSRQGTQLVSVRRGQPAVRIDLAGERYRAVVIGVDDPAAVQAALAG
ncbi:MAG: hypothetical protein ACLGIC_08980 [Acidimicrobiia bacterium]